MNCERFQTATLDLARNQIMDANERACAQAHVDECDDCRRAWNDQLELSESLRKVADQMRASQAPEHIEAQLLAAFRDQVRVVSIHPAPQRWRYWMSAAAAVVLIGFGLWAWRSHVASLRQPLGPPQAQASSATAVPSDSPKQEQSLTAANGITSSTQPLFKADLGRSLSRRPRASSQLAKSAATKQPTVEQVPVLPTNVLATNAETKELATDFVLVGYGNALDLQDGGQLVRVELPRSALAIFGLPMNMDRANERIKADVLVGTDGLARAIRFVEVKAVNKN